jgi:hypothetical protein
LDFHAAQTAVTLEAVVNQLEFVGSDQVLMVVYVLKVVVLDVVYVLLTVAAHHFVALSH